MPDTAQMPGTELRRLMIANDTRDGLDAALGKASRLEHYSGTDVLVMTTCFDRIAEEPDDVVPAAKRTRLVDMLMRSETAALEDLVKPWRSRIASLDVRVAWARDAAAAIVEQAAQWPAQLLIKPVSQHHPVADFLHTPLDWALTRQAPCAVLLSRRQDWEQAGTVLAAVDTGDPDHDPLNREILQRAALLADMLGAGMHVVTTYPDLGQTVSELQVADDFAGIKSDMQESRHRRLSAMLETLAIAPATVHLVEGKPEQVIPRLAERLDATVTVLGTAARAGVARLVIGNTAEHLVSRLACDLMTVRAPWS